MTLRGKKQAVFWLLLVVLAGIVVGGGLKLRTVVARLLELEQQGHAYSVFFFVLELYTEQNGMFPSSFDSLLEVRGPFRAADLVWPADAEEFVELVAPDFAIQPNQDNLASFAPDYATKAAWAAPRCESYWVQIIEHLEREP